MEEPKYLIFKGTELLVWAQLADHLRTRLDEGEFGYGEYFPPQKTLASEYAVSQTTVSRAMSDLITRAVVRRAPGGRIVRAMTAEAESMTLTRHWWRQIAWLIHDNPEAMDTFEFYAPRAWVHGFRADVRRQAMTENDQQEATA